MPFLVETSALQKSREIFNEFGIVVLEGGVGCGKTFTSLTLMSEYLTSNPNHSPLIINSPFEWYDAVDSSKTYCIFIEDFVGKHEIKAEILNEWKRIATSIILAVKSKKVRLIIAGRKYVFFHIRSLMGETDSLNELLQIRNTTDFSEYKYKLTIEEKRKMLHNYTFGELDKLTDQEVTLILASSNVIGFPLLCEKYCTLDTKPEICAWFATPVELLVKEIELYCASPSRLPYIVMLLTMFLKCLQFPMSTEAQRLLIKLTDYFEMSAVPQVSLSQCAAGLVGTLLLFETKSATYTFCTDNLPTAVFYSLSSKNLPLLLEHAPMYLINDLCFIPAIGGTKQTAKVHLHEEYYPVMASKFVSILCNNNPKRFAEIAVSDILKNRNFLNYFLTNKTLSDNLVSFIFSRLDMNGRSLLSHAAACGNIHLVDAIMEKVRMNDATGNYQTEIQKALEACCESGRAEVLQILLKYSGFVTIRLLYPTIRSGNVQLLHALLSKGPNFFLEFYQQSDEKSTDFASDDVNYLPDLPDSHSILHEAVLVGEESIIKYLLEKYAYLIHKRDKNNETPAFMASAKGCLSLLKILLEHGQDLNERNRNGETILMVACLNGHANIVEYLLSKAPGLASQEDNFKNSPALRAASKGYTEIVKQLVDNGCDIFVANKHGQTALHSASSGGHSETIRFVLAQAPDLIHTTDIGGRSAVFSAVSAGHVEIVRLLVAYGANILKLDLVGSSLLFVACQKGRIALVNQLIESSPELITKRTKYNWAPVHAAACGGFVDVLGCLVTRGADILAEDNDGYSVLHIAAQQGEINTIRYLIHAYPKLLHRKDNKGLNVVYHAAKSGHTDVFKILLELGSDVSVCNSMGQNSFHIACINGHLDIVSVLLDKRKYLLEVKDKALWTAAHYACLYGHLSVLQLLVKHGTDLMAVTFEGYTALHIACEEGYAVIVEYLLKEFPNLLRLKTKLPDPSVLAIQSDHHDVAALLTNDVEETNGQQGRSSLFTACKIGNINSVRKVLINMPELLRLRDNNKANAAYVAASYGHLTILKLLKDQGLDVMCCNNNGQTALHIACQEGHKDVARYILSNYPGTANKCDYSNCTPGYYAASHGHVDILQVLVEFGLNVFSKTIYGQTLLLTACQTGQVNVVQYLLDTFPDLLHHYDYTGRSPAFLATFHGNIRILEILSKYGGDLISGNEKGFTPLHLACQEGHEELVRFYIREAPELLHAEHNKNYCASTLAAYFGYARILKILVDSGMPQITYHQLNDTVLFHACSDGDGDIVKYVLREFPELVKKTDDNGATAAYVAAAKGHVHILELFYDYGIELMTKNKFGQTGLHVACQAGHLNVVKFLLRIFPRYVNCADDSDCIPAYYAAANGNLETLKCLIDFKSDLAPCNRNGQSVLHVVCRGGKMDITEYLLQLNPELMWQVDFKCRTPLFYAAECVHCLKIMAKYKADFFHKDRGGQTVLHMACRKGFADSVGYLARKFPELVHRSDTNGLVPLHFAALKNYTECVKILVSCGADLYAKTNDLHSALHLAASNGQRDVFLLFLQTCPDLTEALDIDNWSAAHIAASKGHAHILECLRLHQVYLGNKASGGQTICHLACKRGHMDVLDFIFDHYPDLLHSRDSNKWTPAHHAAQGGHVNVLKKLNNFGISLMSESTAGKTTLHLACQEGHENCVRYLLNTVPSLSNISDSNGRTPYDYAKTMKRNDLLLILPLPVTSSNEVTVIYSRT